MLAGNGQRHHQRTLYFHLLPIIQLGGKSNDSLRAWTMSVDEIFEENKKFFVSDGLETGVSAWRQFEHFFLLHGAMNYVSTMWQIQIALSLICSKVLIVLLNFFVHHGPNSYETTFASYRKQAYRCMISQQSSVQNFDNLMLFSLKTLKGIMCILTFVAIKVISKKSHLN